MDGHSKIRKDDSVRAFISTEADEDSISDEEDPNEETALDFSERKRQTAEFTPLPSAHLPSRLDLLLNRLNAEIEDRTHLLSTLPPPSEFLPGSPLKKRRIARSESPEESLNASTSWDAAFAANPGSQQEFIDGLQLGRELDEITAHYSRSQSQPHGSASAADEDEADNRRFEWNRFRAWVNLVTGQTAEVFQYGIYYVRCRRGREAEIVQRICHDIKNGTVNRDILRNASLAALPGGIYIQARSMLPGNHVLASYLRMIEGFIYPNTPRNIHPSLPPGSTHAPNYYIVPFIADSPTLQFPKHQLVVGLNANKGWTDARQKDPFRTGAWVIATRGRYKGDCGLVVEDDYGELDSTERMVSFLPRLRLPVFKPSAESAAAEPPKKKNSSRPPPVKLVGAGAIKQLGNKFGFKLKYECIENCKQPETCTHQEINRKRLTFLGQTTRGGLALTIQKLGTMKLAETLPDDLVMSFAELENTEIFKTWMPPPSSWSFESGEQVVVVPFDGGTLASEFAREVFSDLDIEDPSTREGKLLEMLPLYCRVEFVDQRERAVPYHFLRKRMQLGDTVQLLAGVRPIKEITRTPVENTVVNIIRSEVVALGGKQGLVVAFSDRTVDVWIPEIAATLSLHPNTLRNLTLNSIAVPFIPWPPFAKFHIGHNNQVIPTNPLNVVAGFEPITVHNSKADTDTTTVLPRLPFFTGITPWKDILVSPIGQFHRKGYRGRVKDVKQDEKCVSGLAVLVEYETINMTDSPRHWYDYDVLRRCDNSRFIHDDSMTSNRNRTQQKDVTYYDFKRPMLDRRERVEAEERQRVLHERQIGVNEQVERSVANREQRINENLEALNAVGVELVRDDVSGLYRYMGGSAIIEESSSQTPNPYIDESRYASADFLIIPPVASTPLSAAPSHSSHWLFDPRIREGLGDNHILIACKGETKDRRVHLRVVNGVTEAYSASGHKRQIRPQDLVDGFRSYGVKKPFKAAGLYLVCEGDHIGKLVRRASEYFGDNMEHYRDPLWTVQVVSVAKENGKHVETIQLDYPQFHLCGASLAEVYEPRERRKAGNEAMTVVREKPGAEGMTNGYFVDENGCTQGYFVDEDGRLVE
ncbi:hypothetical protein BT96DRAFT_1005179 [Gymnopus androsaceus JB14]|uniref:Chromatin elongation factor spt5 n=1 Tax=Gymnopus androsaceus JB14 TaxID=1447944 RepID=A0A6A4GQA0_9AGAR|nr:hypothetical protein BT96DRAFT_1005179 [Gymnopus androsaceus JB14]